LERSFFKSIALANGTHKTTAPQRLTDVDLEICRHVPMGEAVSLLDVGISSGVTTIELLDRLKAHGVAVRGVGVDICVRGRLLSVPGFGLLYDSSGRLLQMSTPLFTRGRPHRSQRCLSSRTLTACMNLLESQAARWCANSRLAHSVDLVTPALTTRPGFSVVEHDIVQPRPDWAAAFDLIRVANVLNLDYFQPTVIAGILRNLIAWLKPDGVLVICRTHAADGSNHGSIYCKSAPGSGVRRVGLIGGGYELDELVHRTGD
jgi:hypothetical protein